MNQLEQVREQCINVAQQYANNAYNNSSQNAAMEIRDLIRALPLPEVSQNPVAWVMTMRDNIKNSLSFFTCKDIGEQWLIEEKELGLNDLKLQPLYVFPPDVEALRKENEQLKESLRYVIEQAIEWQNFATGCEQEETEEMKLAKERAK